MHRLMGSTPNGGGSPPRGPRLVPEAPLHDLVIEQQILGACLLYPEIIEGCKVVEADFYSSQNGELFATLLRMRADGETIDTQSLRTRLVRTQSLARLGGDDYLYGLTDRVAGKSAPTLELRRMARIRDVQARAQQLAACALHGDALAVAFRALEHARTELDALESVRALPSLADVVEGLTFDARRVRTGLPSLDLALRGGISPGKLVVIVGAPGSCKTSLGTWMCSEAELQGACSMYVASDENRAGIVVRIGQQHGLSRDALESPMPAARKQLADDLRTHRPNLHIIDPLRDRLTLEEAARMLHASAEAQGKLAVLVVDSLQTVHSAAPISDDSERERLNAVVNSCRTIADRGVIVIAISEMNRGGYKSALSEQETSLLASGAGTSRIEYGADVQMSLTAVKGQDGHVDLEVNKSRLGGDKPRIRIAIDFARATFSETAAPPEPRLETASSRLDLARRRVLAAVRGNAHLRSQRDVLAHAEGKRLHNADGYRDLMRTGDLVLVDGVLRIAADSPTEAT
jgi:replicative DNA helicase